MTMLSDIAVGALAAWLALPVLLAVAPRADAEARSRAQALYWVVLLASAFLGVPALGAALRPVGPRVELEALLAWTPVAIPDAAPASGLPAATPLAWVGAAYLVLVALGLVRLAWEAGVVARVLWRSQPAPAALLGRLGWRSQVAVRVSALAPLPFTVGLRRPVIVIPERLVRELEERELDLLLRHELEHVKAGDPARALAVSCLGVLFTGHPAFHWLRTSLVLAREMAVDARVAAADRERYASLLVSVAAARRWVWTGVTGATSGGLRRRIERLLADAAPQRRARARLLATTAALAALVTAGLFACDTSGAAGALPAESIRAVIVAHKPEIRACYQELLGAEDPERTGRLLVWWRIERDGRVGDVRIEEDTLESPPLAECVRRAVASWRFPEPAGDGSVEVRYPFLVTDGDAGKPLTREEILEGVRARAGKVAGCLKRARDEGALAPGQHTFTLDWVIQADGSVTDVRLTEPVEHRDGALADCFAAEMSAWKFRASPSAAPIVRFPFGPFTIK